MNIKFDVSKWLGHKESGMDVTFDARSAAAEMRKRKALAEGRPAKPSSDVSGLSKKEIDEANAWFDVVMKQIKGRLDKFVAERERGQRVFAMQAHQTDATAEANARLTALAQNLVGELQWCSGSEDFAPGGKARKGWEKGPAKVLQEAEKILPAPYKGKADAAIEYQCARIRDHHQAAANDTTASLFEGFFVLPDFIKDKDDEEMKRALESEE